MSSDAELLHLSLARRDYLRHPVLLSAILALHALMPLTSGPARRAVGRAIGELKVAMCARRARAKRATRVGRAPHRLNIGCGEKLRRSWLNIDLHPRADLRLDIRRPLPFPAGSCAEIYAEHVLEHLAYPGEVEEVLREWWRVLTPGGTLSVGVPDVETLAVRLTSAGFVDIAQRPYDPARDSRPYTLYLDARKPGRPGGVRQTE